MKSIVRIHAEVRLVIAGDGPEMGTLKDQSTALGIADQVEFTGWMNSDELHQLYQAADLFIAAPTRGAGGEVEAFGLVFVEASLAGLPIVATRSGGIVDIVLEGETGLLVDEDEPEQLAAAIQSLLADPGRARQLGAAGRMRAEELFTRERAADDFSALSADLATRRSQ
jgi:phosphatidylinositol alpha-1,6-mannosyltransferase